MGKAHREQSVMSPRSISEGNNHKCFSEYKRNLTLPAPLFSVYDHVFSSLSFFFHTVWKNTKKCPGTKNRNGSVLRSISPLISLLYLPDVVYPDVPQPAANKNHTVDLRPAPTRGNRSQGFERKEERRKEGTEEKRNTSTICLV